jgi:hypothetical protein
MIKRTRSGISNSGARAKYVCFDCGEVTGSTMSVYRLMGPNGDQYEGVALVHRAGSGCHKGETSSDVRTIR